MPIGCIAVGHARQKIANMSAALWFLVGKAIAPFIW